MIHATCAATPSDPADPITLFPVTFEPRSVAVANTACDVGLRIRMMRSGAEVHLRACGVPVSTRTYGIYRSSLMELETRTRTNTNPNGTEANAAGRSGNACALRKQCKCGMIQEGEGPFISKNGRMPGGAGRRTSTSFEAINASSATGISNLVR